MTRRVIAVDPRYLLSSADRTDWLHQGTDKGGAQNEALAYVCYTGGDKCGNASEAVVSIRSSKARSTP
jgi:hypothetical protein